LQQQLEQQEKQLWQQVQQRWQQQDAEAPDRLLAAVAATGPSKSSSAGLSSIPLLGNTSGTGRATRAAAARRAAGLPNPRLAATGGSKGVRLSKGAGLTGGPLGAPWATLRAVTVTPATWQQQQRSQQLCWQQGRKTQSACSD
jgi:hypothetical protein